ncbi:Smr/MutS family protein [candidate division KSB1 bacterium]|nr:Smr/MutS family protein [candidate division KSB1 bacterium]
MQENIWTKLWRLLLRSAAASASSNDDGDDESDLPEVIEITDLIDLHGTPVDIIPALVQDFIDNALSLGLARVQIIHGKGRSRLKHLVYQQLKGHPRVVRFYDAPPELGGWGRTIVELDL